MSDPTSPGDDAAAPADQAPPSTWSERVRAAGGAMSRPYSTEPAPPPRPTSTPPGSSTPPVTPPPSTAPPSAPPVADATEPPDDTGDATVLTETIDTDGTVVADRDALVGEPRPDTDHSDDTATSLPATDDDPDADAETIVVTESGRHRPRHFRRERTTRAIIEWAAVIIGALVVALIIKTYLLQAFSIPSTSMVPTLQIGDRVLVNKLSYDLHDINRGDVVVFERPANQPDDGIKDLIKRVIALEGETIEGREGSVWINGQRLVEPYVKGIETEDFEPVTVPEGHVFVMGDNRTPSGSRDSRYFGPIDTDLIVGRAFVQIWPLDEVSGL